MRKMSWLALTLLLLFALAGCEVGNGSQQQNQQATSSLTPIATKGDSNILTVPTPTATPDPTPTATATPRPHPTTAPTARPTTSSSGGGSSSGTGLAGQLFALINQERAAQGLSAYTLNSTLSAGALKHSTKMAGSCGLSHQCPGEPDPCTRVSNEGISWTSCGENVGYSSPDPTAWGGVQQVEVSMINEQPPDDGHRRNLLSTSFHRVGVGVYVDSRGYVWVTEDFAS